MGSVDYESDDFFDYIVKLNELSKKLQHFDNKSDLNELFRALHSIKAITYYYKLEEISILIEKTETILMFVSNYECTVDYILEWLDIFSQQIDIWVQQLKHREMPGFFDVYFEEMPLVQCKSSKRKHNKVAHIIIGDSKYAPIFEKMFKDSFKYVDTYNNIYDIISAVEEPGISKVVTGIKFKDGTIIDLLNELRDMEYNLDNLYLLVSFTDKEKFLAFKHKLQIKHIINIKSTPPVKVVEHIRKNCEGSKDLTRIPSNNISLVELSNKIQPLSKTILKLKEMCFGDSDIKDIINTINTDPMFSGILLKSVNTPFIGLTNRVSKVSIAVTLMGKKRVGSMVMAEMSKDLFDDEPLSAYNITLDNLLALSQIRARFVTEWIKYIDLPTNKKEYISSLIHLLPIGTIITNKALVCNKANKRFLAASDVSNPSIMEKQMLGWSNYDALTKIFELWNMPRELIKMSASVANYGIKNNFKDLNIYAVIIILSTQIFRMDGTYFLEKTHLRFAQANSLVPNDMENIYKKVTEKLPKNLFTIMEG
jgi:HD-like signal output (HDOD) protein